MPRQTALPSAINAESISDWLSRINFSDIITASNELLFALKELSKLRSGEHDLPAGLDVLAHSVAQQSDKLIILLAQTAPDPSDINNKSRKIARLNALLIRALCLAYIRALGLKPMPASVTTEILAKILRLTGESIKANSLYYERGSTTLWKKMGSLYQQALREKLLDHMVCGKPTDTIETNTLAAIFKKNLILDLFEAYRCPYHKRAALFEIAQNCADKLDFSDQAEPHFTFYWDTQTEHPIRAGQPEASKPSHVLISTERLTRHLKSAYSELTHEQSWFCGIWHKLTGYNEIFESLAPGQPRYFDLTLEFNSCFEQVKQFNRLANIERLSSQPEQKIKPVNFELLPIKSMTIGHIEQLHAKQPDTPPSSKTERANVQPTRFNDFCSAQIRYAAIVVNSPILILSPKQPPELGIIRAKKASPEQAIGWALIQKFPGSLTTVVTNYNATLSKGLLLKKANDKLHLILPAARYSCGDKLEIPGDRPRFLTLERLQETNEQFICFQVLVD